MPLKLRPATAADLYALTGNRQRAKASSGFDGSALAEFEKNQGLSDAALKTPHMTVAEQDGVPVGFCGLVPDDNGMLLVEILFVAPDARRQGIGDLLLTRAEDVARKKKLSHLHLKADTHSEAFYKKRGFRDAQGPTVPMSSDHTLAALEKPLPPSVFGIGEIDLTLADRPWPFETENKAAIAAHFEEAKKRIGLLWNGRTLKLTGYKFEDGMFKGTCTECSYAAFLAWRDWGAPDSSAFNLFGSAVIRSDDGALLYGVMADHTATAGDIYPPGGNLDPTDRTENGKVDIVGAIHRELKEETGLKAGDLQPGAFLIAFDGPRISVSQVFKSGLQATDLRERIMRFSDASKEKELADIRIIRSPDDLQDPAIVSYARAIGEHLFTQK